MRRLRATLSSLVMHLNESFLWAWEQPQRLYEQVRANFGSLLAQGSTSAKSKTTQTEDMMTQASATQRGREQADDKNAIRPFRVNVPEAELQYERRLS